MVPGALRSSLEMSVRTTFAHKIQTIQATPHTGARVSGSGGDVVPDALRSSLEMSVRNKIQTIQATPHTGASFWAHRYASSLDRTFFQFSMILHYSRYP